MLSGPDTTATAALKLSGIAVAMCSAVNDLVASTAPLRSPQQPALPVRIRCSACLQGFLRALQDQSAQQCRRPADCALASSGPGAHGLTPAGEPLSCSASHPEPCLCGLPMPFFILFAGTGARVVKHMTGDVLPAGLHEDASLLGLAPDTQSASLRLQPARQRTHVVVV